jgi:FlgD Ig-like domain
MNFRHFSILFCVFLLVSSGALSGAAAMTKVVPVAAEKDMVIDGHVFHNVGSVWNHVSNFGLIGSMGLSSAPFSTAPSARWPGETGDDHLYAASLWVGGVVLGERLVSVGAFSFEFRPTDAPGDTIYPTAHGAPGGNRYPWSNPDDDNDGQEDEDPLNGLDDDDDGLVDEDFAAIGDQHFVCRYNDFQPGAMEAYPDHTPLNISVVQQSIQWSNPLNEDFIGYDFTITNVGVVEIGQVYLGLFSDFDIGPENLEGLALDDLTGFLSTMIQASDGSNVPVQMAYMHDGAEVGALGSYAGWVLCGHTTDPLGVYAPTEVGVRSSQVFAGQSSFDDGGDPTNDDERYEALSLDQWDGNNLPGSEDDYRTLISSGPFPGLLPGESISYQVALVLGADLDDLVANAAEAVVTYLGSDFDRDNDPVNGNEFTTHWLPPEDGPVAAVSGQILAERVSDAVELQIQTNLDQQSELAVIRCLECGVSERRWAGAELTLMGSSGNHQVLRLTDQDQTGWPRQYDLVYEDSGGTLTLDSVTLDYPQFTKIELKASPNPFNPMVNISFSLPRAGHVLLQVFDIRGHMVRTLLEGEHSGGTETITWKGEDDQGRTLASGVYQVVLSTEDRLIRERITLVR